MTCRRGARLFLFTIILGFAFQAQAQPVQVQAGFVVDSVVIGDEVPYYLTARYPQNLQLVFPDSTFSFQPFEFQKKKYLTTETRDSISYDSAVYIVSTFEIDTVQYLQLPVFVLHQNDCTAVFSNMDSVRLKELVTFPLPDTLRAENLPLLSDTEYRAVDWLLNYPVLSYVLGGLLVLASVGWLIFGKRIRKHYAVKRLQKQHALFLGAFNTYAGQIQQSFSSAVAESTVTLWKKYMEGLDAKPYTKLTTKEAARLLNDSTLSNHLRIMDAAVYGHDTNVTEPLHVLRSHAEKIFQQKLEQVNHG